MSVKTKLPYGTRLRVYQAAPNQALALGNTIIRFDTVVFDNLGEFNVATYTFTARQTGIYHISCTITVVTPLGLINGILSLVHNGAVVRAYQNKITGSALISISETWHFECIQQLTRGDTLRVNFNHNWGAGTTTQAGQYQDFLCINRIA